MRTSIQSRLETLVPRHRLDEPVHVTRPSLPPLEDYRRKLEPAWATGWVTNDGPLHRELRDALCGYLDVEHVSLCCNGTVALLLALQAAGIDGGEVITTPFTFPATPHALHWNRVRPVFCDVEPRDFTLDPERVEAAIGPETRGILPVHVFGYPCDVEGLAEVAARHGLPIVYDAAHAMGVRMGGRSLVEWGDRSVLSFHATKLFNTAEGGAIVSRSAPDRERVDFLKNFGIADEETVIGPGINGKMNELQAALGLLQLERLDEEIEARRRLAAIYRERLAGVPGLVLKGDRAGVRHNHAYFTVLVEEEEFGLSRDELCTTLRALNVVTRKYFYPLCSHYPPYADLPSARPEGLPVAERVAERVLCLPLYGSLAPEIAERVAELVVLVHTELGAAGGDA